MTTDFWVYGVWEENRLRSRDFLANYLQNYEQYSSIENLYVVLHTKPSHNAGIPSMTFPLEVLYYPQERVSRQNGLAHNGHYNQGLDSS